MRVVPAPARSAVVRDRDRSARALRVTTHPDAPGGGLVVLSLWDGDVCATTLRLDPEDAADLVRALTDAAVAAAPRRPRSPHGPTTGEVAAAS
ncbi:hypothetical protein FHN55_07250 [Streptomyces sp. NP160]|uniref:hypothetical protein n=1 Tax=Streptomyces sp. NP160 TaxID=2586637 RepID=UPI0011180419|nr:hypothetical protein [Streptomyces sp. NP160]TNM68575.1 hypothetical protein FHN55_07250 [Streptomyces sp. NP160]